MLEVVPGPAPLDDLADVTVELPLEDDPAQRPDRQSDHAGPRSPSRGVQRRSSGACGPAAHGATTRTDDRGRSPARTRRTRPASPDDDVGECCVPQGRSRPSRRARPARPAGGNGLRCTRSRVPWPATRSRVRAGGRPGHGRSRAAPCPAPRQHRAAGSAERSARSPCGAGGTPPRESWPGRTRPASPRGDEDPAAPVPSRTRPPVAWRRPYDSPRGPTVVEARVSASS